MTASPTKLHHHPAGEGSAYSFRTLKSPTGSTHPPLSSYEQEGWASSLPPLHPSSLTEASQHHPHYAQRAKKNTGGSSSGSTIVQDGDLSTVSPTQARRKGSVPKGDDSSREQQ